jgi:hypothetical protein
MALIRSIPTRLLEAAWRETINCYARPELNLVEAYGGPDGWRIFAHPFLPGKNVIPRQINITPVPPVWEPGCSGVSDTEYALEFLYTFPAAVFDFKAGGNSYLDELIALRIWLLHGGSANNRNARLPDPDHAGAPITGDLVRFTWERPVGVDNGIEVAVIATFTTNEDRAGSRV